MIFYCKGRFFFELARFSLGSIELIHNFLAKVLLLLFRHHIVLLIDFVLFFELILELCFYFIYYLQVLIMLLFHILLYVLDLILGLHCRVIELFDPVPFLLLWCFHSFMKTYIRLVGLLLFYLFRCFIACLHILRVFLKATIAIVIQLLFFIKCGLAGSLTFLVNGKELIFAVVPFFP